MVPVTNQHIGAVYNYEICKNTETDIDSIIGIYVLIQMNPDPSYNLSNLSSIRFQSFNIHQYYNAVEDERTYMNEYTSLIHRYNDFIIQGNAMFTRMEHTIRENLSRAVVRQSFYFNHLLRQLSSPNSNNERIAQPPIRVLGDGTTMADLLLRYLGGREFIHSSGASGASGASGSGRGRPSLPIGPPTNDQIARATLNTFFSNILSPVNATCPISRDEFNDESEITMIRGCNHIFNRTSLRDWFVNHSTCPMCRNDIRLYRPPMSEPEQPAASTSVPRRTNLSIDSVDENQVTFSYDLPRNYTNEQIYQHIVNTISGLSESEENENVHDYNDAENLD